MAKHIVIGSNSFSGQDFIDLLLDDPSNEVIGISRSSEYPDYFLRYKQRENLTNYSFQKFDLNLEMPQFLEFLDTTEPQTSRILRHRVKSHRVGKIRISGFKQIVSRLLAW